MLTVLRRFLSPRSALGKWLRLAKIASKPIRMHDVIHRETLRGSAIRFIQIGANDGVIADPLHPFIGAFGWSGAMVEPQPSVFTEKLEPLYRDNPHVQLINAAVGLKAGTMPLYVLSFSNDRWATGKASLDRSVIQEAVDSGLVERLASRHGVQLPAIAEDWIASIEVPVVTVAELLNIASIEDFDLLHVDTEGANAMIVQQFDFARLSVRIVQFEHFHLSDSDLEATCNHLSAAGFQLHANKMDILATRGVAIGRTVMTPLSRPWKRQ
jgi:FkbM family methyltransferase